MESVKKTCEIYFNILNHIFIGAVSIHVTWYCFQMISLDRYYIEYNLHVWLSTIGVRFDLAKSVRKIQFCSFVHF